MDLENVKRCLGWIGFVATWFFLGQNPFVLVRNLRFRPAGWERLRGCPLPAISYDTETGVIPAGFALLAGRA